MTNARKTHKLATEMIEYERLGCTIQELAEHFNCTTKDAHAVLTSEKRKMRMADYEIARRLRSEKVQLLKETCKARGLQYFFRKETPGYRACVWSKPRERACAFAASLHGALEAALTEYGRIRDGNT